MLSSAMEFWVIMLVVVDLLLIILFIVFMRKIKAVKAGSMSSGVEPLPQALEPLLKEAKNVAEEFEVQLKEKQRLVRKLNDRLDSRIISLNLLLSRAEGCLSLNDNGSTGADSSHRHVYDVQQEIIAHGEKGLGPQEIAERMGISIGEVKLVLELKKKFEEMEKNG